ncbi:MAG: hypothetical protein ABIF71_12150 [Planctomycetota bacterium]
MKALEPLLKQELMARANYQKLLPAVEKPGIDSNTRKQYVKVFKDLAAKFPDTVYGKKAAEKAAELEQAEKI